MQTRRRRTPTASPFLRARAREHPFPSCVIYFYIARARGPRPLSRLITRPPTAFSPVPSSAGRFRRFDTPSKSSNRSFRNQRDVPPASFFDPHDRRLPREDFFSRLDLRNLTRRRIHGWFRGALSPWPSASYSTGWINRQSSFKYKSRSFLFWSPAFTQLLPGCELGVLGDEWIYRCFLY